MGGHLAIQLNHYRALARRDALRRLRPVARRPCRTRAWQLTHTHTHTDNVNQHLDERAKEAIRSTGALLVFMPTYSPEWNPIEFLFHYLKHIWTPQNLTKYSGANAAADCMLHGCHAVDFKRSMGFFQHAGYKVPVHKDSDEAAALLLLALLADSD